MEGLNYLSLCGFLCITALIIGTATFFVLFYGTKEIILNKFGNKYKWVTILLPLIIAIIVAYIFFQSRFAPAFPDYYMPNNRPSEKEIIGTWVPTSITLELIRQRGYDISLLTYEDDYPVSNISIEFYDNGKFTVTNMPDLFLFRNNGEFHSGYGTWSIEKDSQDTWMLEINFSSLSPAYFPDPPLSGSTPCPGESVPCGGLKMQFELWNRDLPYTIGIFIPGTELNHSLYFSRLGDVYEH